MFKTNVFQILAGAAYIVTAVSGAQITFDCSKLVGEDVQQYVLRLQPSCLLANALQQCGSQPSWQKASCRLPSESQQVLKIHLPTPARTTCDEYPFASTYGLGASGWYSNTGATTRCVSRQECSVQGGSLAAFYASFGRVDNTPVDVFVQNHAASPWCNNAGMAPDADMKTGSKPPSFVGDGNETTVNPGNGTIYEYRTAANRTIRSLSGPVDIGSEVFVPNLEWQKNPKVSSMFADDQLDDDDCEGGSALMQEAVGMLEAHELGETDKIVERI
ncbi:hypothetical protein VNI00_013219 [Paramarasmius palmivorus]|uniref:Deoxyribonuclease NucA/NucB domain-containing protein n=1 Tax=Paramarasmius palmivorus TaxID=297713 RepID=A0AAW0C050_9AGAR